MHFYIYGEHDLISYEHTCLIAMHLPHSTLRIVPGENHGSYIWHSPKMGEMLLEFIDAWSMEAFHPSL